MPQIKGPPDQNLTLDAASGRSVVLREGGTERLTVVSGGAVAVSAVLRPNVDGTRDIGTSSLRWRYVHAAGGTVPSVLHKSVTSAQTTAVTTEETLWSYSLPAGTLASDGQAVRVRVFGTTAANTNSKVIRLKFGATTLVTRTTSTALHRWVADAVVFRTGATAQVAYAYSQTGSASSPDIAAPSETLANAVTIALTGKNGTASAGDITFLGAIVEFLP